MPTKRPQLYLSGDPEADRLLSEDPLALLIGLVLDQQIPLEWAFQGPHSLMQRLDERLDAAGIAEMPEEAVIAAFAARPALHRYPAAMAKRVQALARHLVEEYGGDAAQVWTTARDGKELLARLKALPGFGQQKAKIFVALLGKQFGLGLEGWREVASPFGEHGSHLSVADIDSPESLAVVRDHKRQMKAAAKQLAATSAGRSAAGTKGSGTKGSGTKAAGTKAAGRKGSGTKAAGRKAAAKKPPAKKATPARGSAAGTTRPAVAKRAAAQKKATVAKQSAPTKRRAPTPAKVTSS